jgi:FkbM family methyltransferase
MDFRRELLRMSRWLNLAARAMRVAPVPDRVRSEVWRRISRGREGQAYTYPVRWRGVAGVYGGVCGFSDQALLSDFDSHEAGSVAIVGDLLRGQRRPVVLDVGAHNGEWLFVLKAIAPAAVIHAFEPFPALAAFLHTLVERNRWTGVQVTQTLVGATPGEGELHFTAGATDCASTVVDFQATFSTRLRVPRLTLDDYVEARGLDEVALIKVDVEGGEREVLQGAARTLARLRPPLLLELLFTTNPAHLQRQRETIAQLTCAGYRFFQIQSDGTLRRQHEVAPDPEYRALNYLVTASPATLSAINPTLTA